MEILGFVGKTFFEKFWLSTDTSATFTPFSKEHFLALGIIVSLVLLVFIFKSFIVRHRKGIANILAFIMFCHTFLVQFWYYERGLYSVKESLPLYLCRIAMLLCMVMLLTKRHKVFEVAYFWTMSGALIGLLNCDIGGYPFPHWMYFQFFVGHGGMLISTIFMMVAFNYRVNLRSLKRTYLWSLLYLVITFGVNFAFGANYSYLMAKPQGQTILDIFPKYPYYIPLMIGAMFIVYFLLFLPFGLLELRKPKPLMFERRRSYMD